MLAPDHNFQISHVLRRVGRHKSGILVWYVIVALLAQICWVMTPFTFARFVKQGKIFSVFVLVPVSLFLMGYAMDFVGDALDYRFSDHLNKSVANWSMERLFLSFRRREMQPEMVDSINTVNRLSQTCTQIFQNTRMFVLGLALAAVVAISMSFYIHRSLGCFMLVTVSMACALFGYSLYRGVVVSSQTEKSRDEFLSEVGDTLANMPSVFAGNQVESELKRFRHIFESVQLLDKNEQLQVGRLRVIINIFYLLIIGGMLLIGAYLYHKNIIDAPLTATVVMLSMYIIYNFDELNTNSPNLIRNFGKVRQAQDFLNTLAAYKLLHPEGTNPAPPMSGKIIMRNVSVTMNNRMILQNMNLTVQPGEIVLIKGVNGSGKSTLLKMLFGTVLYDGSVQLGQRELSNMTTEALRACITYVPQVPTLFHRTVYENISYGTNASRQEVQNVMHQFGVNFVCLDDMIKPNKLSGGQQQLLYLLRTYLHNKSLILLLDEPTSALDNDTRDRAMTLLRTIMQGRTVLLVTHDENLQQYTTRTVVLEKGAIKTA